MADVEKTGCCAEAKECAADNCSTECKTNCHDGKEECKDSCHKKPCGCKGTEDCKCSEGKCGC